MFKSSTTFAILTALIADNAIPGLTSAVQDSNERQTRAAILSRSIEAPDVAYIAPISAVPDTKYRAASVKRELNQRQRRKLIRQVPQLKRR